MSITALILLIVYISCSTLWYILLDDSPTRYACRYCHRLGEVPTPVPSSTYPLVLFFQNIFWQEGKSLTLYCKTVTSEIVVCILDLEFRFSSLFQPCCSQVVTSQLYLVEETGVPGKNHRLTPSHFLTCPWWDSNPNSGERQLAVCENTLDNTATKVDHISFEGEFLIMI